MGPTYYSFDVGEVHYVMLDNTVYINTGGTEGSMGKRNYHSYVTDQQLAWLRDDLGGLARQVAARGRGDALSGDEQLQRGVRE